jgi:N-acetyl-anhydromuramyl-L-alanine amidase AmpD
MTTRKTTDLIVFHCSATKPDQDIGAEVIRGWHVKKGWSDIGYHFVVRRNGALELGRPLLDIGAHVQGFNASSVGVCMVGGLDAAGGGVKDAQPGEDAYTAAQWVTAHALVKVLRKIWPAARLTGHRDLSPDIDRDGQVEESEWLKTCPGFDAAHAFRL